MRDLVRAGSTLVLVSHNLGAIEALCERTVFFRGGRLAADGPSRDVLQKYLAAVEEDLLAKQQAPSFAAGGDLEFVRVALKDSRGREVDEVPNGEPVTVRIEFRAVRPIRRPIFEIGFAEGRWGALVLASMLIDGKVPEQIEGDGFVECTFSELPLQPRLYELWAGVRGEAGFGELVDWQRLQLFRVTGETGAGLAALSHSTTNAPIKLPYHWRVESERGAIA
jgi:lipopolysaccharide transport system ATP-binding protein